MTSTASQYYSGDTGEKYFAWQNDAARVVGRLEARKFAPYVRPSDTVVDLGCGGAHILAALQCAERIGIEVNPHARAEADARGVKTVESSDLLPPGHADVVISNHALEHTLRPLDELRGLRRVMKADGRLVLCVPVDDWRAQMRWAEPDPSHHLYTWTPRLLHNLLKETGFETLDCDVIHRGHPGRATAWAATTLPTGGWDALCALTAVLVKRRELLAVARPFNTSAGP